MHDLETMDGLIEELSLGSARGGRRQGQPVAVTSVRALAEGDLELLANPPPVASLPSVPEIRHQHHQLAGLIAKGIGNAEISLITGFSLSYISMLRNAPDMKELVDYYASMAEERTVDALARLRNLGITSVEELQSRINTDPSKFTSGQLMDMIEIGLIKPMAATAGAIAAAKGGATGSGIQINLNFKSPEAQLSDGPGPVIEGSLAKP